MLPTKKREEIPDAFLAVCHNDFSAHTLVYFGASVLDKGVWMIVYRVFMITDCGFDHNA